jgi:hypothetical protein
MVKGWAVEALISKSGYGGIEEGRAKVHRIIPHREFCLYSDHSNLDISIYQHGWSKILLLLPRGPVHVLTGRGVSFNVQMETLDVKRWYIVALNQALRY